MNQNRKLIKIYNTEKQFHKKLCGRNRKQILKK